MPLGKKGERKRKNARESDQRERKIPEENFRLDGSASNERNTGREQRKIRIFFQNVREGFNRLSAAFIKKQLHE